MDDLSPEQIAQWKAQYGQIFKNVFKDKTFVFRAINLREFQSLSRSTLNSAESEDEVLNAAVIYPDNPDFDSLPAGFVGNLAAEILDVSGFQNPKSATEKLEGFRSDVLFLMKAMIIATMPDYTEEQLDNLTFNQLLSKVVLAEKIIEVNQAAMGGGEVKIVLVDPEEEALKEEQEKLKHTVQKPAGTASYDDPIAQRLRQALG